MSSTLQQVRSYATAVAVYAEQLKELTEAFDGGTSAAIENGQAISDMSKNVAFYADKVGEAVRGHVRCLNSKKELRGTADRYPDPDLYHTI